MPALVGAVLLAIAANVGALTTGAIAIDAWRDRLMPPVASPGPTTAPSPASSPAPATPSATGPTQSTGPVTVTDEIMRGVVLISARTPNEAVAGTGMVLSPDGLVLTNYHVVRSTESVRVTIASTGAVYEATLVGRDSTTDVAVLQLDGARGLDAVALDDDDVRIGDIVIAAGNANGQGYVTANRGNVLSKGKSIQVRGTSEYDPPETLSGLLETNAAAWPGDSGGPMYDAELEVLGMTTAGSSEEEQDRQVYAVPIDTAMRIVDRIIAGDESGSVVIGPKAYLGIVAEPDDSGAVVVSRVEPGTPASRVGLAAGDTILSVDGRDVATRAVLSRVLDGIEPGTTVDITWETASGQTRSGDVTLAESSLN